MFVKPSNSCAYYLFICSLSISLSLFLSSPPIYISFYLGVCLYLFNLLIYLYLSLVCNVAGGSLYLASQQRACRSSSTETQGVSPWTRTQPTGYPSSSSISVHGHCPLKDHFIYPINICDHEGQFYKIVTYTAMQNPIKQKHVYICLIVLLPVMIIQ